MRPGRRLSLQTERNLLQATYPTLTEDLLVEHKVNCLAEKNQVQLTPDLGILVQTANVSPSTMRLVINFRATTRQQKNLLQVRLTSDQSRLR